MPQKGGVNVKATNLRAKLVRAGFVTGLGILLSINAGAVPQAENEPALATIEPSVRAGASNLPVITWQDTEIAILPSESDIAATAPPADLVTEVAIEPVAEQPAPEQENTDEPAYENPSPQNNPPVYDKTFFALAVQAEGYTLGYEGMRYIASAMLNLARYRGCSIDAVLKSGAYTVVNNGTVWRQNLLPESMAVVEDELAGQIDTEIKYFRTSHYHSFGTPSFHYGNVYFSK